MELLPGICGSCVRGQVATLFRQFCSVQGGTKVVLNTGIYFPLFCDEYLLTHYYINLSTTQLLYLLVQSVVTVNCYCGYLLYIKRVLQNSV